MHAGSIGPGQCSILLLLRLLLGSNACFQPAGNFWFCDKLDKQFKRWNQGFPKDAGEPTGFFLKVRHASTSHGISRMILGPVRRDVTDVLTGSDLRPNLFADPEDPIEYSQFQRLLARCERLTNCNCIGLLAGQRTRLADFGLARA